jgi:multicomponent Na+:H+ antiporter subunit D
MDYQPYTTPHVMNQLQLLLFASLAFTVLIRTGLYPPEVRSVNLDADVLYRRTLPTAWQALTRTVNHLGHQLHTPLRHHTARLWDAATRPLRPNGRIAIPWSTHLMVWWAALLLGALCLLTLL